MIDYSKCGATFRSKENRDGFGRPRYDYGVILKATAKTVTFRLPCEPKNRRLAIDKFSEKYEWKNEDYVSVSDDWKNIITIYGDEGLYEPFVQQMLNGGHADCMFFDNGQKQAWYDQMDKNQGKF